MTILNKKMCSTAVAAVLSLPLALGPVWAQQSQGQSNDTTTQSQSSGQNTSQPQNTGQSQDTDQSQTTGQSQDAGQSQNIGQSQNDDQSQNTDQQQSQQQSGSSSAGSSGDAQADAIVATVDGAEIRGSDVLRVIGLLPPQLQSQSPDMLVPVALEQLILRELILEKARSQNLAEDPEVTSMVTGSTQTAEEDAMVQVWLDRELAKSVTDDAVQKAYDEAQAQGQQNLPPLDAVRPQIEQHLRQQAMQDLRTQLREGADIVLYDPTGRPVQGQGSQNTDSSSSGSSAGANGSTNSASSSGSSAGQASGSDAAKSQAEQAGLQGVEPVQGGTILKGKSANNEDVYMIVGPSGELLALAAPLPGNPGAEAGAVNGQGSATDAPEPGEPAQSGFMATQAQPAMPNMWDPATIEQGMRQLELGTRAAAGEVSKP